MSKQVKVTEIKVGDIIVGEQYKLQCGKYDKRGGFNGLEWKTYDVELEVLRVKELENGEIRLTVASVSHVMTKRYKKKQMLEIKSEHFSSYLHKIYHK